VAGGPESLSVSVTSSVTLPAQPTVGSTFRRALGGDGVIAPHSLIAVNVVLDHDASAGTATITVGFDDRYSSLLPWAGIAVEGASSDVIARMVLSTGSENLPIVETPTITQGPSGLADPNAALVWIPPPYVIPGGTRSGTLSFQVVNTNGDTSELSMYVLQFDINVVQKTPLPILLSSVGPMAGRS